jgi:plastocyanin
VIGYRSEKNPSDMKHMIPLLAMFCSPALAQTTHTISATDFEFNPSLLTITAGDTVRLNLAAGHSFREVTASAWDMNVTQPVIGWDFGPFDELNTENYLVITTAPDTLYYICVPHADMGMKGRIIIQEASIGMESIREEPVRMFPIPASTTLWLSPMLPGIIAARVTDAAGRMMELSVSHDGQLNVGALADGFYHASFTNAEGHELARRMFTVMH